MIHDLVVRHDLLIFITINGASELNDKRVLISLLLMILNSLHNLDMLYLAIVCWSLECMPYQFLWVNNGHMDSNKSFPSSNASNLSFMHKLTVLFGVILQPQVLGCRVSGCART